MGALLAIVVGFPLIFILAKISKSRATPDFFAAVNSFCYFGLLFNLYYAFTENLIFLVTVAVIVCVLWFRYGWSGRWI